MVIASMEKYSNANDESIYFTRYLNDVYSDKPSCNNAIFFLLRSKTIMLNSRQMIWIHRAARKRSR